MTSRKFTAARIHQMRAGRSYLKAHKDWRDPDGSSLCPRCEEEEESFKHVITGCPALAEARVRHSEFSFDNSPDSLVWKENKKGWDMMKLLISFISLNKLNFPDDKNVFAFMRATQVLS